MNDIPVLETERLVLRGHRETDFESMAALWSYPEVARFTAGRPLSREESWRRLVFYRGMWSLMGFGYFAVEDKATGDHIGDAGVMDGKRQIQPSLAGSLEAGWIFAPAWHGRGYAAEAMSVVLAWCERRFPAMTVTCIIDPENGPSLALAHKLGFRDAGPAVYQDKDIRMMRIAAPESAAIPNAS